MDALWFIFGTMAVIAAFLLVSKYRQKKRSEALQELSIKIGFAFVGAEASVPHLRTPPDEIHNVLRGRAAGFDVLLYDYDYQRGTGRSRDNYSQTVAAFRLPGSPPQFELQPENFLNKIGSIFGHQDIDFDSNPGFSKRYLLRGDEQQVRQLFNSRLLLFFEKLEKGWLVEMNGPWLMAYKHEKRVKAEADQFQQFLDTASSIATAVSGQGDDRNSTEKAMVGYRTRRSSYFIVGLFGIVGPLFWALLWDSVVDLAEGRILRDFLGAVMFGAPYAAAGFLSGALWPDTGANWGLVLVAPLAVVLALYRSFFLSDVLIFVACLVAATVLAHLGRTWTIRRGQTGAVTEVTGYGTADGGAGNRASNVPNSGRTFASWRNIAKSSKGSGGLWVAALAIIGIIVFWVIFTFFYAQSHVNSQGQPSTAPATLSPVPNVQLELAAKIGFADSKVEVMQGNNLDIYVSRDSWQNLLFPDRSFIREIGKTWCDGVEQTYLPAVRIREIHDGRTFASYSCTLDRISLNSP